MMFNVGSRVKCIETDGAIKVGAVGTVLIAEEGSVGVEWDENVGGHSLDDRCEYGHGWWIDPIRVELEGDVKMGKFKVGDYVVANSAGDAEYSITNRNAVLKVVGIDADDDTEIYVQVLHHKTNKYEIGHKYWVSAEHFDLRPKKEKQAKKKIRGAKKMEVAKDITVMGKLSVGGFITDIDTLNYISESNRIVTVTILVRGKAFMGVAKCDKHDRFIAEGGIALATTRAMQEMADYAEKDILDIL